MIITFSYRIPIPKQSGEKDYYARILNAVREVASETQTQTTHTKLKLQQIRQDDLFLKWEACLSLNYKLATRRRL